MSPKNTPPHKNFEDLYEPDVGSFIVELRKDILKITIEELVNYFNWNNEKYYQQIVNGYKTKDNEIKLKQPTVKYLFTSLNYAMNNHELFKSKEKEINALLKKYIIKF